MIEDYSALRFWFSVVQWLLTLAIGIYVLFDKRKKRIAALETTVRDQGKSIADLEKESDKRDENCGNHKKRTSVLEIDIRDLPSRTELSDLAKMIGSLTEKLGTLDGRLTGINRAVDLLNEHHLKESK